MSRYYFYELKRDGKVLGSALTLGIGGEYVFPLMYEEMRFSCSLEEVPGVFGVWWCSCEALGKIDPPIKVGEIVMEPGFPHKTKDGEIILEDVRFGQGECAGYPSIITRQPFQTAWNGETKKYEPFDPGLEEKSR